MQKLFPAEGKTLPELRFSEFQGCGEWESAKLEELALYRRGSFPQPYGLPEWYDEKMVCHSFKYLMLVIILS